MKRFKLICPLLISLVLLSCTAEKNGNSQNPCGNVSGFNVVQNKANIDFTITTDKTGPYEVSYFPLESSNDPEYGEKFITNDKTLSKTIGQDISLGATGYSFFVRNICSSTSKSDWGLEQNIAVNNNFCAVPNNIRISSSFYNTIAWDVISLGVAASNYQVQYGPSGFTPVDSGNPASGVYFATTVGTQLDATMLQNNTYDIYVRSFCSSTNTSQWIGPKSYICVNSTNQCAAPTYASFTVETQTTTTFFPNISWENDFISQYEVALKTSTALPTQSQLQVVNPGNTVTFPNLLKNTNYYFFVRKICSGNTRTSYFGPYLVSF
jgi:hypothetical protein